MIQPDDISVLFVHGIGEQRRSDALVQCIEPIRNWIIRWTSRDGTVGNPPTVHLVEATLRDQDVPYAPAHARLVISGDNFTVRWLCAESWWADSFFPPTYKDLLSWVFKILPLTFAHHTIRQLRQRSRYDIAFSLLKFLILLVVLPAIVIVLGLFLLWGVLPIKWLRSAILISQQRLVGIVGDSYSFLYGSIHGSAMASRVAKDIEWLKKQNPRTPLITIAHSQGAAVAYAAITTAEFSRRPVRPPTKLITYGSGLQKLLLLNAATSAQVVFAWCLSISLLLLSYGAFQTFYHFYQGSGLTLRAALTSWGIDPNDVALLKFDYGNIFGFNFLDKTGLFYITLLIACGSFIFYLFAATGSARSRIGNSAFGSILNVFLFWICWPLFLAGSYFPLLGGVALLVISLSGGRFGKEVTEKQLLLEQIPHWSDYYSSVDPVPNGPLSYESSVRRLVPSREITNFKSVIRDHTSYWKNIEEFVAAIVYEIIQVSGKEFLDKRDWDDSFQIRAAERRGWRVGWLKFSNRILLFLIALAAVQCWEHSWRTIDDLPQWIRVNLAPIGGIFKKWVPLDLAIFKVSSAFVPQMLWVFSWIASFVFGWLVLRFIWAWWNEEDAKLFFRRQNFQILSISFVVFASCLFFVLPALTLFAIFDSDIISFLKMDPEINIIAVRPWYGLNILPHDMGVISLSAAAVLIPIFGCILGWIGTAIQWSKNVAENDISFEKMRSTAPFWLMWTLICIAPIGFLSYRVWGIGTEQVARSNDFSIPVVVTLDFLVVLGSGASTYFLSKWGSVLRFIRWLEQRAGAYSIGK